MSQSFEYCRDLVRQHDPDRFLLSLFAPARKREALWALFAFHYEVAKTREVVSETQLGLIRLQWWREEIGKIYSGAEVPENEVLQALAAVIWDYDLPQEEFEALVYGREFDLEGVLPANVEGMMTYIEQTNVPLMRLVFYITQNGGEGCVSQGEGEEGVLSQEAVRGGTVPAYVAQIAVNYGLIGLLRAVPFYAYQDRCLLPQDLIQAAGLSLDKLYQGKEVKKIKPVVELISKRYVLDIGAYDRFFKVCDGLSSMYFKQLKNNGYNVFEVANLAPPKFRELRLFFKSFL